jgi:hypothetical protein
MRRSARVFLGLVVPPIAVATISGCGDEPKVTAFNPGVVAIPHALFLPASADGIALGASYFAWVELNKESQEAHTLDLAVWPSRSAALHALAQYRAGGPKTRPRGLGTGWPRTVEKVEAIRTVTLAWYAWPTLADERVVTRALRFSGSSSKRGRDYTALWVIPGTTIDADASAAAGPALYSARLEGGVVGDALTVAIWPSENAAKGYIDYIKDDSEWRRIRNATIDNTGSFGSSEISDADVAAIRKALH